MGRRGTRILVVALATLAAVAVPAIPSVGVPLFSDGFESGNLSAWTRTSRFQAQRDVVASGEWAGRATTTGGASAFAFRKLSAPQADLYFGAGFNLIDAAGTTTTILRFRSAGGGTIVSVNARSGMLSLKSSAGRVRTSTIPVQRGTWHEVQLHAFVNGTSSLVEVWFDGVRVDALSGTEPLGTAPVGRVQLGGSSSAFDAAFDDVVADTSFIGGAPGAPAIPTGLHTTSVTANEVALAWDPAGGASGYTVYRDGSAIGTSGTTSFRDATVVGSTTYRYSVDAFNSSGRSGSSTPIEVTTPAGGDPAVVGAWSAQIGIGMIGIHAAMLETGAVLLYSGSGPLIGSRAVLFDPVTGSSTAVNIPFARNVMCSGMSFLPDGRLMATGGEMGTGTTDNPIGIRGVTLFDPATGTWSDAPPMAFPRWYPSNVLMPDGTTLVLSGSDERQVLVQALERFDPITNTWTTLPASADQLLGLYPKAILLPSGNVFVAGPRAETKLFDPATNTWSLVDAFNAGVRRQGAAVLLPGLNEVLAVGGTSGNVVTATAERIDMSAAAPEWTYAASMAYPRRNPNLVLLPDGTVLALGGGMGPGPHDNPVKQAELYDPATDTWTLMASQSAQRAYHSTAVLLPDGRVLSAGDNSGKPEQVTVDIYSPPYLFGGPRPTIGSAPTGVGYGETFEIVTAEAADVSSVVLIRPAAVTHAANFDQRFVDLAFTAGEGVIAATAPGSSAAAPPGYYMLFIVDGAGVPSVATFVLLS